MANVRVVIVLMLLMLFSGGDSALPQDGAPTSDGAHRVVYAIDSITGKPLFADDIDPLFFDPNPSKTPSSLPLEPEWTRP